MIDTFDKHIDFCCFYQHKTVVRIFRITENRLFENDFDRFPELENLVRKKIRGKAVGATVCALSAGPLKNTPIEKLGLKDAVAKIREFF